MASVVAVVVIVVVVLLAVASATRSGTSGFPGMLRSRPRPPESPPVALQGLNTSGVNDGVTPLRGEDTLKRAYKELRERPDLSRVQAIWSADYGHIENYFEEEVAWLRENPSVTVERIVVARDHQASFLRRLADEHSNLQLYTGTTTALQFELYLCEYNTMRGRMAAGILVVIHPLNRSPEFGILIDGQVDEGLAPFVYALRDWFENVPKQAIEGSKRKGNVWNPAASRYDSFVSRDAEHAFIREFIRAEDSLLERVILAAPGPVSFVEFGAGTGRTIMHLRRANAVARKVAYFIGFDRSSGMVEESQRKRDRTRVPENARTFFFALDAARSTRAFWNGYLLVDEDMNDHAHISQHGLDHEAYAESNKVISCLLNTLGVVDEGTRAEIVANMFVAGGFDDTFVLSVFDRAAFGRHALRLYESIEPIVGAPRTSWQLDQETAEFRAGRYYSHWFGLDEVRELVDRAGGTIDNAMPVELEGELIGHVVTCRRKPKFVTR